MREEMYRIDGKVVLSEENRCIMITLTNMLLRICGARKREKMILGGREVEVAALPHLNGKGVIEFDYSIFENIKRGLCLFDPATGLLDAHGYGYMQLSLPIGLIMAMETIFSEESCRFMIWQEEDRLGDWVNTLISLMPDEKYPGVLNEKAAHKLQILFNCENEDEFLEYWGSGSLNLSPSLREDLQGWIRDFPASPEVEPEEVENLLGEILTDMVQVWNCRLGDRAFAEEFLSHREDRNHRKALALVRSFMYRDLEYFPELTKEQALDWIIRRNHPKHDTVAIPALLSLLVNHDKRKEMFGF